MSSSIIVDDRVILNGQEIPLPPNTTKSRNVTIINNRIYVNGYEYKNGKWKKTLAALWHKIF